MATLQIATPRVFAPLIAPARYKAAWGGRGSGKSYFFASLLIERCYAEPGLRVVCIREFQKSIKDSVKRLLEDTIADMGLGFAFTVLETEIRGKNGSHIIFIGMANHTAESVKSLQGYSIAWVEEAQSLSQKSLDLLRPTIREEGSEIWFSFNPENDEVPVDKFFRGPNKVKNAIVVEANFNDNPYFPEVLRQEMEQDLINDYDKYLYIWKGNYRRTLDGAVYAKEIRTLYEEKRVTKVLPIAGKPVETFWDLGKRDHTAVWFAQIQLGEYRILRYYQARGEDLPHFFKYLDATKYSLGNIYLPHDAEQDRLTGTIAKIFRQQYPDKVKVIPRMAKKEIGIQAVKRIFPQCYFDEELTKEGLKALGRFRYDVDPDTGGYSANPLHDEYSDGCLIAGSVVQTFNGGVKIENVCIGDMVWTPNGYAEVINSGIVGKSRSLIKITGDGCLPITCTPNHKFLTKRGFIKADSLLHSDRIFTGREWQCKASSLVSMAFGLGYREAITKKTVGVAKEKALFIEKSGLSIMAQFLKNTTSTISTAINLIMNYLILNACREVSICVNTPMSLSHKENLIPHQRMLYEKLQNGTPAKRESNGIDSTVKKHGIKESGKSALALSAANLLCRLILLAPSTAREVVKLERIEGDKGNRLVYDLTVKKESCYQANGLLVSNSDAFAQLALSLNESKPASFLKPIGYFAQGRAF